MLQSSLCTNSVQSVGVPLSVTRGTVMICVLQYFGPHGKFSHFGVIFTTGVGGGGLRQGTLLRGKLRLSDW